MSTCKDCIHEVACKTMLYNALGFEVSDNHISNAERCNQFKPKADYVEVVRCGECEYCCISTDPKTNISIQKCGYVGFNPVQSSQVSDDFYCGYGERKESEVQGE